MPKLKRIEKPCLGPECVRMAVNGGLCNSHSMQRWRHPGEKLTPLRKVRSRDVDLLEHVGQNLTVTEEYPTCWTWTEWVSGGGYGYLSVNGSGIGIHRWLWTELVGPIPEGHEIDHLDSGGNTLCCNPAHLQCIDGHTHRKLSAWRAREEVRRQGLEPGVELEWMPDPEGLPTMKAWRFAVENGLPFWALGGWMSAWRVEEA